MTEANYNTSETSGSVMVCAEIVSVTGNVECNLSATLCSSDGSANGECY